MVSPILRQLDLPNLLTLTGLFSSLISAIFAIQGNFCAAVICIMYAGLSDMLDGVVARKMKNRSELQSQVGKHLDSIVDVCSFGFVPTIFAYCFGLQDFISITVLIFYVGVSALRLAYFNSTGLSGDYRGEYFTGLPVTCVALFIPLAFTASFLLSDSTMKFVLDGVYLFLGIAMIANFKVMKVRGIWYVIFTMVGLVLTGVYSWVTIVGS